MQDEVTYFRNSNDLDKIVKENPDYISKKRLKMENLQLNSPKNLAMNCTWLVALTIQI
jgi:hypothetical protein